MPSKLANQIVLITGASSGFGADAARLFAKEGCILVLAARRMDRLTALAEQIRAAGGQAFAVALDVTEQSQIDVNLRGVIQVVRAVLPHMLERRSGTIINMSSAAGLIAAPMYSIYAATKYGVRGFTDALRREVAPFDIRVCGIYPGPAVTEFSRHSGSDSAVKKNIRTPDWLYMTSDYVARRTVGLAKHPRRTLIIPWWFRPILSFDYHFPGLVDWFLKVAFVKRFHHLDGHATRVRSA